MHLAETPQFQELEQAICQRLGLQIFPAEKDVLATLLQLCTSQIEASVFNEEDIVQMLREEGETFFLFCVEWYRDCQRQDYGEQWNPEEGDQQEGSPASEESQFVGQGFSISYALFLLYARRRPDELEQFVRDRDIPHAARVAKDIARVLKQVEEAR